MHGLMTVFSVPTAACKNKIKTQKDDKCLNCTNRSSRWASRNVEKNLFKNHKCYAPEKLLLGTQAMCEKTRLYLMATLQCCSIFDSVGPHVLGIVFLATPALLLHFCSLKVCLIRAVAIRTQRALNKSPFQSCFYPPRCRGTTASVIYAALKNTLPLAALLFVLSTLPESSLSSPLQLQIARKCRLVPQNAK